MADRRETYAALLTGDHIGKTITVQKPDGDLLEGVVDSIVHLGRVVGVFVRDDARTLTLIDPNAIAVVS